MEIWGALSENWAFQPCGNLDGPPVVVPRSVQARNPAAVSNRVPGSGIDVVESNGSGLLPTAVS